MKIFRKISDNEWLEFDSFEFDNETIKTIPSLLVSCFIFMLVALGLFVGGWWLLGLICKHMETFLYICGFLAFCWIGSKFLGDDKKDEEIN